MRVVLWELLVGLAGLALGVLLILGHGYLIGVVFAAASIAWLAYRMDFVYAGPAPGAFSRGRAHLDIARATIVWLTLAAVGVLLLVSAHQRWSRDFRGEVASFALTALGFFLMRELTRRKRSAELRLEGGYAEERVVNSLEPLAREGWQIENNVLRDDAWGDVDVVARDPRGRVFAIETKSRDLRRRDVRQALGNAAWLQGKLGVRWVNAVVCVPGDAPARADGKAWIVGASQLTGWLRTARV